ncbi:Phospholipase/Carboxylesterase [Musa troglodytarum]|uniref:Phospholipase/Carboxylesterase n=1 Tax=Musa troglodytarum TaxID=320322 RepID=A0A9E7GG26_9LILI|nr:Phospholipase/Carboxylesterase [Musa troglodytarum]
MWWDADSRFPLPSRKPPVVAINTGQWSGSSSPQASLLHATSPALPAQGGDPHVPRRQLVRLRLASIPSAFVSRHSLLRVLFDVLNACASNAGSRTASRRHADYGRTYVLRPKGRHRATVVWLHGLGDNGASWYQLLETLPLPNIKWICPTAPTRSVALLGGFPCTACNPPMVRLALLHLDWSYMASSVVFHAGFDVADPSQDGPDDADGLEASAAHIANLLSSEPADVKLGIGGFSMGAAAALHSASCFAQGRYGNGGRYPINLSAVVGLSGWLPCSRSVLSQVNASLDQFLLGGIRTLGRCSSRSLKAEVESSQEAARRAASLPLLLCHGTGTVRRIFLVEIVGFWLDPRSVELLCFALAPGIAGDGVVPYQQGERSAETLRMSGFRNLTFKAYNGLEHYTIPEEMDAVCKWLTARLRLDGSRP